MNESDEVRAQVHWWLVQVRCGWFDAAGLADMARASAEQWLELEAIASAAVRSASVLMAIPEPTDRLVESLQKLATNASYLARYCDPNLFDSPYLESRKGELIQRQIELRARILPVTQRLGAQYPRQSKRERLKEGLDIIERLERRMVEQYTDEMLDVAGDLSLYCPDGTRVFTQGPNRGVYIGDDYGYTTKVDHNASPSRLLRRFLANADERLGHVIAEKQRLVERGKSVS